MDDSSLVLLQLENLISEGKYDQALSIIDEHEYPDDEMKIKKAIIFEKRGQYQESLDIAVEVNKSQDRDRNPEIFYHSLITMCYGYWRIGDFELARETLDRGINELSALPEKTEKLHQHLAEFYYVSGIIYSIQSDIENSFKDFNRSYEIRLKYGTPTQISHSLNALGVSSDQLGNFKKAIEYHKEALKIKREQGNLQDIARSLVNIAVIYRHQGKIDKARSLYEEALELFERVGSKNDKAHILSSIATIEEDKSNFEGSLKLLKEALQLNIEAGVSDYEIISTYHSLIELLISMNRMDEVEYYLEEVNQIVSRNENLVITHRYKLLMAKYNKSIQRIHTQAKAIQLYSEVKNHTMAKRDFRVKATFNLIYLRIQEIQRYGSSSPEILDEINDLIEQIHTFAKEENSPLVEAKLCLLKSRVAMITIDIDAAVECLEESKLIANEHDLKYFLEHVNTRFEGFLEDTNKYRRIFGSMEIEERIGFLDFNSLFTWFDQGADTLILNQETPLSFIIADIGGSIKYSREFQELGISPQLLSSFISAMNSFSNEVSRGATLEHIKHDRFSILLDNAFNDLLVVYVFDGLVYQATRRLDQIITSIATDSDLITSLLSNSGFIDTNLVHSLDRILDDLF